MARASSIDKLPAPMKAALNELLRDPRVSQIDAAKTINDLLKEEGHEDRVSKSAVNRYSQRMEKVGRKLRESREISSMWMAKLGEQPQGKMGQLVNEMLRAMAFDLSSMMQDQEINPNDMPGVIKMVKEMAIAMHRLEQAASENTKRDQEIRKQVAEEAANHVHDVAVQRGMTAEDAQFWREEVLGMGRT